MQIGEPARVAAVVTRLLEKLDIPYAVVGSLASSLHGVPRAIDIPVCGIAFQDYFLCSAVCFVPSIYAKYCLCPFLR